MRRATLSATIEAAWAEDTAARRWLVRGLAPVAGVYRWGMQARNRLYDAGVLGAERVPAAVIAVGNLTVGGSGKTPTALWLAEALRDRGRRVVVVSRGYGKRQRGVVLVGRDGRALVDPADGGDEAVLVALRSGLPVVTGEHRVDAARLACREFDADTIVLDDGFQHRALVRDVDLVLLPADHIARRWFPAGPLREGPEALARAQAALALGDERTLPAVPPTPPGCRGYRGRIVPTHAVHVDAARLIAESLSALPRRGVLAVAGVARPARFWSLLERLGVGVHARVALDDHHAYDAVSIGRLRAMAAGRPIVTTEKDLVKLMGRPEVEGLHVAAVRVTVDIEDSDDLLAVVMQPKWHSGANDDIARPSGGT